MNAPVINRELCSISSTQSLAQNGSSSLYLVKGLYKVAKGWQEHGEMGAARRIFSFIISIADRQPALKCVEITLALANFAVILSAEESFMDSENHFLRALASCIEVLGDDHPIFAEILRDYASMLRRMGLSEEAWNIEVRANLIAPLSLPQLV